MNESIGHWDNSDRPSISKWDSDTGKPIIVSDGTNTVFLDAMREIMEQAIQKALHPEPEPGHRLYPLISFSHIGIQVRFTDFGGQEYEGVLYPTKVDMP